MNVLTVTNMGKTIEHLFLKCTKVKDFLNNLQDWLSNNCYILLNLDEKITYLLITNTKKYRKLYSMFGKILYI